MRLQRSDRLQNQWYTLPSEVRRFVESLKTNPHPTGALQTKERPGRQEELITGYWVIWDIDEGGNETIVRVTIANN